MKEELQLILKSMDDIKYGFVDNENNVYPDNLDDWDNNFGKLYHLQSPEELIKNKYGVCWDQVELERFYLKEKNIESTSYFIIARDNKQESTHTFIVVKLDKYYWLKHSWEPYKGLHEYDSLDELLKDVKNKFKKYIKIKNINEYKLDIFEYDRPKYNINCIEFMKYCENSRLIDSEIIKE